MDIKEIKKVAHQEKDNNIQILPIEFYNKSLEYINDLEFKLKKIENGRSIEYKILDDEISSLIDDIDFIFMKRVGKIIERATFKYFSTIESTIFKKEYEKLLPLEKKFFDDIIYLITNLKKEIIITKYQNKENNINDKNNWKKNDILVENKNVICNEYSIVRILKDIPEFIGIDKVNYHVFSEDIVTLPTINANVLVSRHVAIFIQVD